MASLGHLGLPKGETCVQAVGRTSLAESESLAILKTWRLLSGFGVEGSPIALQPCRALLEHFWGQASMLSSMQKPQTRKDVITDTSWLSFSEPVRVEPRSSRIESEFRKSEPIL